MVGDYTADMMQSCPKCLARVPDNWPTRVYNGGGMNLRPPILLAVLVTLLVTSTVRAAETSLATQPAKPFAVEVVDDQTGRGVPLVELKTVANVCYITDSAGLAAIDDPAMMGR